MSLATTTFALRVKRFIVNIQFSISPYVCIAFIFIFTLHLYRDCQQLGKQLGTEQLLNRKFLHEYFVWLVIGDWFTFNQNSQYVRRSMTIIKNKHPSFDIHSFIHSDNMIHDSHDNQSMPLRSTQPSTSMLFVVCKLASQASMLQLLQ